MIARVPLTPCLTCDQNVSRPAPNVETTPMPVIAIRGNMPPILVNHQHARSGLGWRGALCRRPPLLLRYFYLVQLGRPITAPAEAVSGAVAFNLILFSVFALHHSLAARLGVKAWLSRWLPRHLERSLYVWIASLLFLAVCLLWRPLPGVAWQATGLGRWRAARRAAGRAAAHAAQRRADRHLGAGRSSTGRDGPAPQASAVARTSTPSVSSAAVSVSAAAAAAALEISGPYRWVRHPIYLGWVLMVFGAPAMTTGRLLFAGVSTLYLVVAIPLEERSLTVEFGPAYTAYQHQVRWRLVPGLW